MRRWRRPRQPWASDPIINRIKIHELDEGAFERLKAERRSFWEAPWNLDGADAIAHHKAWLGEQAYTVNLTHRFWVWESEVGWRAYVSNKTGSILEVKSDLNDAEAFKAWDDYQGWVGLKCPYPNGTRVLAYADNEPGTSLGYHPRQPGCLSVLLDGATRPECIQIDNLLPAEVK